MIDGISGTIGTARNEQAPQEDKKVEENKEMQEEQVQEEELAKETKAEITGKGQEVDTTA